MKPLDQKRDINIFKYTWQPLVLLVITFLGLISFSQLSIHNKNLNDISDQVNDKINGQYSSFAEEGYLVREQALKYRLDRISSQLLGSNNKLKSICLSFTFEPRENISNKTISACPLHRDIVAEKQESIEVKLGDLKVGAIKYELETKRATAFSLIIVLYILASLFVAFVFHYFFSSRINKTIIRPLLKEIEITAVFKAQVNMAKQVAHDIRSPLSALSFAISDLNQFPFEKRLIVENAYQRINDIANNLLHKGTKDQTLQSEEKPMLLFKVIDGILSEKRFEYANKPNVIFNCCFHPEALNVFSKINETELGRILSNLINNSVEASEDRDMVITLGLRRLNEGQIEITIKDNGKGIPQTVLSKIGTQGFSFGKSLGQSGSGLGLFHARNAIEQRLGKLNIVSLEGEGTTVQLILPLSEAPEWFSNEINIGPSAKIVVLDDDSSVYRILKEKFQGHEVLHFQNPDEWGIWVDAHFSEDIFYICDFELRGFSDTGLDLIVQKKIQHKSLLISSYLDDDSVTKKCEIMSVKGFPKRTLHHLKITNRETEAQLVLIDDDKFIRLGWDLEAKKRGVSILTFKNVDDFLRENVLLKISTPIYIDSHLGPEIKGEIESKKIFDEGFSNIYLATNYFPEDVEKPVWIKSIVGKKFPSSLQEFPIQ